MEVKENIFKATIATIIGGLAAYLQHILIPIIILVVVMIIDHVTGMTVAWFKSELNSKIGRRGILKKVGYLFLVCSAGIVDWLIYSGLTKVGVTLNFGFCFGLIVTIWLIINELISILENLAEIEVPMPKFLLNTVKHLKDVVEHKADNATNKE